MKYSFLILVCFLISGCGSQISSVTNNATNPNSETISTQPNIKGPNVGEGGNDYDQIFSSLAISPSDSEKIYIGSEGNGIFKSTDGGATWSWLRNGMKYGSENAYPEIFEIAINPINENFVFFVSPGGGPGPAAGDYSSALGGTYKSTDEGTNWQQKNNGLENGCLGSIAFDPSNPSIIYVSARGGYPSFTGTDISNQFFDGGIYRSTNSGESWSKIATLPTNSEKSEFWKILLTDSQTIYAFGLNFKNTLEAVGIIKSTDGGAGWTKVNPQGSNVWWFEAAKQNSNLVYAVEGDIPKIHKSIDGGANWSMVQPLSAYKIRISPFDENIVLFATFDTLFKSTDGLATINAVLTPEGVVYDIEFSNTNPNIIYVGCRGLLVYKSTDGGTSFLKVANLRNYINTH